jgi:hypothetical protein
LSCWRKPATPVTIPCGCSFLARWSQVDPAKAARFALGLPNAQFAIGTFIRDLARHNLDAALAVANCQESPPDPFFLKGGGEPDVGGLT